MRDFKTRAVSRLKNGGILMELDSADAATHFDDESIRKKFLALLHPAASIKPRSYQIVVQFIPLTFRPDNESDLREIEETNGFDEGDITRARWIKPIARRRPSQTCGHAIMSFSSPHEANEALANGLFICQKKVYAEKCKKEPLRCLKCHRWGHMASDCEANADTCGTCAQHHRTSTCTNTDNTRCVSCNTSSHASWDRECPVFLRKCRELNGRMEDNSMPYFPTRETWTQVMEPPKQIYVTTPQPPPPPRSAPAGQNSRRFTQSTIQWQRRGPTPRGGPLPSQHDSWNSWEEQQERDDPAPPPNRIHE
jgi:hypothetical protein